MVREALTVWPIEAFSN